MPCFYCERPTTRPVKGGRPTDASVEHLVPLKEGGEDTWANRVEACRRCNHIAGHWSKDVKLAFRDFVAEEGWDALPKRGRKVDQAALEKILRERMEQETEA